MTTMHHTRSLPVRACVLASALAVVGAIEARSAAPFRRMVLVSPPFEFDETIEPAKTTCHSICCTSEDNGVCTAVGGCVAVPDCDSRGGCFECEEDPIIVTPPDDPAPPSTIGRTRSSQPPGGVGMGSGGSGGSDGTGGSGGSGGSRPPPERDGDEKRGDHPQALARPSQFTCEDEVDADKDATSIAAATDPVYLYTGEFSHQTVDLRVRGRGLDFVLARRYRSKVVPHSHLGRGWDWSYNISARLGLLGSVVIHDGNGRADKYHPVLPDLWASGDQYRQLVRDPTTGEMSLLFEDGGSWRFNPLYPCPGEPCQIPTPGAAPGAVSAIIDRNGNTLTFAYEFSPQGSDRLESVTDTLGRVMTFQYHAHGLLQSVTDFAGRTVSYEYFGPGDPGGDEGMLKGVTSPAVTNTPHGNDFPNAGLLT